MGESRVLQIHRAERADGLADALAQLLAQPLADPFQPEVVAVPTRGMERWLSQRMSAVLGASPGRADGVCANVLFPFPHRLVTEAVAAACGIDPASDPWLPERMAWTLLEVVQESFAEPWLAELATYLGADADPPDPVRRARRLSAVRHLANLFDRYALHRPQMLEAWAQGRDRNEVGDELAAGGRWQAELWRRLRTRIGLPGPAERRGRASVRLREDAALLGLPPRLSVFGLTRLPAGHVEILRAIAHGREVHLFLLHPSPSLWDTVARGVNVDAPVRRRADDPTTELPTHPLLASWGRDAREMQLVLSGAAPDLDHHHGSSLAATTLLGAIQSGVQGDTGPPGAPSPGQAETRAPLDPEDRSIEIHSCHGRVRQVEVLRDAILHALAEDESLEPRDVIVMCPDIETFAPLIQATFGAGEPPPDDGGGAPLPGHLRPLDLRVRLADRSLRQTNPVLGVLSLLLELAEQRLTASQILDLADRDPVRRRFRFDDDELTRLQGWISQTGIRWGLDAEHRAPFKLERLSAGTWRAGLQRLLLGVTMTEEGQRLFGDVLPLDDVDSRSIDLAGRVAELITRVGAAVDSLRAPKGLADWAQALSDAADSLTFTIPRERWQRAELGRVLDEMVQEASGRDARCSSSDLSLREIRAHLMERLAGRPTRANFRTGHLTVCTLMPMRSVPHRVVCLLGLDDGAFPRKALRDGDDLMLADPQIGERDPRSEDRQLLLDALLAATQRLIITFSGNDERTNTPLPAAVPVGELLDVIDATVTAGAHPARERVLIRHPLQPFDQRNFTAGALIGSTTWSFDPVTLEGARALAGTRPEPPPFLTGPLPPRGGRVIELEDLVRFVEHPVRAFLRQRLGISLRTGTDEVQDALLVELDGLQRWSVGQRLLEARLAGVEGRTAIKAEIARGTLPPGVLGHPVIRDVYPIVDAIVAQAHAVVPEGVVGDPVDVRVALGDGRVLHGTVAGVRGSVLLSTTYSRVAPKHRLAGWVRLLALTASRPEQELSAATVGRAGGRDDVRVATISPLPRGLALDQLLALIDLFDRGMREPLPVFCATSAAYAAAAAAGQEPAAAGEHEWRTEWGFDREDSEPEHRLVLGGVRTFADLLQIAPSAGEDGDGWELFETSRLGRLARRMWNGLLTREEVRAR